MKLCITEKPSVAQSIAPVIGATHRRNGYLEGNGYLITWCVGHLVGLAMPEEYGEEYQWKNFDKSLLPIVPETFQMVVLEKTKEQFGIVKQLMHRADVEEVIDCGDAGSQGHYLQWLVRKMAGCQKPVKRFLTEDYTESSIRKNMNELHQISEFTNVIKGEYCKAREDWIIGMSFSRFYSSSESTVHIGRVKTPTLAFVAERYQQHEAFVPQPFYRIFVNFKEGFIAELKREEQARLTSREEASKLLTQLNSQKEYRIQNITKKEKKTLPPQLHYIDSLEREGVRLYGYSPIQVLQAAQSLYEKYKLITYPRAESPYITEELVPQLKQRIKWLRNIPPYKDIMEGKDFDRFTDRIVDGRKIEDHHAILATDKIKTVDLESLPEVEKNVLHLVLVRMLSALSSPVVYSETQIEIPSDAGLLFFKDKVLLNSGYEEAEALLPVKKREAKKTVFERELIEGDLVQCKEVFQKEGMTSPPALHTEETLLVAMEHASNTIENAEEREAIRECGIGTKATRAGIIQELFDQEYVEYSGTGKVKNVVPTKRGLQLIDAVPEELKSAALTAETEIKIKQVAKGERAEEECLQEMIVFVRQLFEKIKAQPVKVIEASRVQQKKQKAFQGTKESLGFCPYCGGAVYENAYYFICEHYKKDSEEPGNCLFSVSKKFNMITNVRGGVELTAMECMQLLLPRGLTTQCISKKGKPYRANFKVEKEYSHEYNSVQFQQILLKKGRA